jgi:hypothetical protein
MKDTFILKCLAEAGWNSAAAIFILQWYKASGLIHVLYERWGAPYAA